MPDILKYNAQAATITIVGMSSVMT